METETKGEAAEKPSPLCFGIKETSAKAGVPIAVNLFIHAMKGNSLW
jgi:hypothetical protein